MDSTAVSIGPGSPDSEGESDPESESEWRVLEGHQFEIGLRKRVDHEVGDQSYLHDAIPEPKI
jgi:hypothetical protein